MTVQEDAAREAKALRIEEELTNRAIKLAEIKRKERYERRPYIGYFFVGLAIVVCILAFVGWFWHYTVTSEREDTRQLQLCLAKDGAWLDGDTCVFPRSER